MFGVIQWWKITSIPGGIRVKVLLFFLLSTSAIAQDSFTKSQEWCAKKSEANMAATKRDRPDIAKTILSYLYEYSRRHHTCVAVMEYSTKKDDTPYVQIFARNMVTNQPMKA
jgi:hypothetical protein